MRLGFVGFSGPPALQTCSSEPLLVGYYRGLLDREVPDCSTGGKLRVSSKLECNVECLGQV